MKEFLMLVMLAMPADNNPGKIVTGTYIGYYSSLEACMSVAYRQAKQSMDADPTIELLGLSCTLITNKPIKKNTSPNPQT